jgi:GTP cyclohydrolase I
VLKVDNNAVEVMLEEMRHKVVSKFGSGKYLKVYGVPRGGIPVAFMFVHRWKGGGEVVYDVKQADIIVDDIRDSGATQDRYDIATNDKPFFVLFDKLRDNRWKGMWLVLPWETDETGSAEDIVTRLFQFIGEDPNREGLKETPARFLAAWREWSWGYTQSPAHILKTFEDGASGYDEMVVVHNVPFISKCEHHLADVIGHAHVGYIPDGKIVGLSKLARVVEVFARRLQVQERATVQIAEAIVEHLQPKGVGVIIRAAHGCMSTRGTKIHGSTTTTSAMRGALFDKPQAREEFLTLCKMAEDHK